jgi:hypothetical protein
MNPTLILDRIEGNIAIIECNSQHFEIPSSVLPSNAQEGDRLELQVSGHANDQNETEERLARLKSQDSGDDIIDL